MKKLLFAIAGAAAFAAMATDYDVLGFETFNLTSYPDGVVANKTDTGAEGTPYRWVCAGDDASAVKAYDAEFQAPNITGPAQITGTNAQYLNLDTNGSELKRNIKDDGTAQALNAPLYIDTLVQFTPSESAPSVEDLDGAKLAIWLSSENGVTNLCVRGLQYSDSEISVSAPVTYAITNVIPQPGTWYRLTVKAVPAVLSVYGMVSAFTVAIDGVDAVADKCLLIDGAWDTIEGDEGGICTAEEKALIKANKVFGAMADLSQTGLTSVGFKGTGALDDFVVTDVAPDNFGPAGIDFTLTWPAGLTAVSYTIDGGEPVAISGASPLSIPNLVGGEAITFIVQNADGAQKTLSATAADGEGIDATSTTFTWADYLGAAVDGAYEIDNLAELKLFQKGVANTAELTTVSTTFKLTADVALDAPWPGIGLQNGKDVYSTEAFNAAAFCGTFDGQNHTISGFQMVGVDGNPANNNEGLDYCGFFNSTYSATIQNLKIQYAGSLFAADTTSGTKESGATFVGVAKASTLRNLTTVAGTVSCSKGFGGIVGFLTSGTTVDSCTNNVNMTSLANNKCGGIAMIAQGGSAVTITNCQNNGTQTTGSSNSEYGAIVGYVGLDITIADCETTVGRFLKHQGSTVTLQGVNKGDATVAAYHGAATPGLNFATVGGSVATFVADSALAAGNTYKVLGPSATATYEFAVAGSISFDTNLIQAVTFAITAAQGLDAPTETTANGVVTFTVAAAGGADYVVEIDNSDVVITPTAEDFAAIAPYVDTNDVAAVNTLLAQPITGTTIPNWQALFLGVEPTTNGLEQVAIKSISFNSEGKVEVVMADGVTLKTGRGVTINLILKGSDDLSTWTTLQTATDSKAFTPVTPALGETKKFYKVVVEFAGSSAQP